MADPETQSIPEEEPKVPAKEKEVLATKVRGIVKWFNVKSGYGFINRHDTKEDVFVHQSAIIKNNPRKYVRSVGDGEEVEFDVVVGEKGNEAANVTGPEGEAVRGSPYAANKRRGYRRRYYRRAIGGPGDGSEGEMMPPRGRGRGGAPFRSRGGGGMRRFYRGYSSYRGRGGRGGGRGGPIDMMDSRDMGMRGRGRGGRGRGRAPRGYYRRYFNGPAPEMMGMGGRGRRFRRGGRGRGRGARSENGDKSDGQNGSDNDVQQNNTSQASPQPVDNTTAESSA